MSEPRPGDTASLSLDDSDSEEAPSESRRTAWYRGRVFRFLSWAATAGGLCYAVVRLFGLETGWLLITTVAFTPYVALIALVGALLQVAFRHWRAAVVSAVVGLALVAAVVPRAVPSEQPSAGGEELRVMSVNLYVGEANLRYILDLVDEHDPDLLSVQELTPEGHAALTELGLDERLPHSIAEPLELAGGTAVYSRYPLERLEEVEPNGIFYQVAAEVTLPDESVARFMAVHTAAPVVPDRIPHWESDFTELPRADDGAPWILAGDFNATLDHQVMRDLIDSGYTDAADAVGSGLVPTWRPVEGGYLGGLLRPPPVTLDHVLVDERVAVTGLAVLGKDGSDHAPVVATIRMP